MHRSRTVASSSGASRLNTTRSHKVGSRYRIGEWEFDVPALVLRSGQGERPLMPKRAELLAHLAAADGKPLTRNQLLDLIWPETLVSDHALNELISQLRKELGDNSRSPSYIATIPKRGYRLIASVQALSEKEALRPVLPPDRSLTVRPIRKGLNDADPLDELLVDALIDEFVCYPEIRLMFPEAQQSDASIAYSVEVQLRKKRDGLTARALLKRTADHQCILAEEFRIGADDEVSELGLRIARHVRLRLTCDRECQSARNRAEDTEAAELACAAIRMNYQINQHGEFEPALMRAEAERAVALDPALLEAWQMLPIAYLWLSKFGQIPTSQAVARSRQALDQAFRLDPENAYTFWLQAVLKLNLENDLDGAEQALSHAISIDPLHPNGHWFHSMLGFVHRQRGALTQALNAHSRAVRIFDADGRTQSELAEVLLFSGHLERAVETAQTALSLGPFPSSVVSATLAGFRALMALGRQDAARDWLDNYLSTVEPGYRHHAAYMHAALGQQVDARKALVTLKDGESMQGYTLVLAHLRLNELPQAIAAAKCRTGTKGQSLAARLLIDPELAPLALALNAE